MLVVANLQNKLFLHSTNLIGEVVDITVAYYLRRCKQSIVKYFTFAFLINLSYMSVSLSKREAEYEEYLEFKFHRPRIDP